jgi:predicted RNase H-like HicB family nuclease
MMATSTFGGMQMNFEKYVVYPAVFELVDEEGFEDTYNITFPDVPGAISFAQGFKQAMFNASEALGLILYDAQDFPKVSKLEDVKREFPNAEVHLIGVDLETFAKDVIEVEPKVKKNTTIPASLAKQAEALGINFSAVLTKALRKEVQEYK